MPGRRMWAEVNARAVESRGTTGDVLFFMRAGFTGIQKHCPLLWAGDQSVDFSRHDGLVTVIVGRAVVRHARKRLSSFRYRGLYEPFRQCPHSRTHHALGRDGCLHAGHAHARGKPAARQPADRPGSGGASPLLAHDAGLCASCSLPQVACGRSRRAGAPGAAAAVSAFRRRSGNLCDSGRLSLRPGSARGAGLASRKDRVDAPTCRRARSGSISGRQSAMAADRRRRLPLR